ncbi:MAG: DUF962 domain-containing protein [Alphaproteobacteria bacterium]|nr:DUF962 domain-containing protein [Alphaproteobacteria bacterium]
MKSADQWFAEYGESHQHPVNKAIHWVCVPAIAFSTVGLFMSVPMGPIAEWGGPWANLGTLLVLGALGFYLSLSARLAAAATVASALVLAGNIALAHLATPLWMISAGIFAAAWVVQLVGHQIEGKKPSFFKDLQFLLIGPLWLIHFGFRRAGVAY